MNRLPIEKRAQIIGLLVEGMSMRAVTRIVGCSISTVTKLLEEVGFACNMYQSEHLRNLPCKRVQCDEIWAFCYSKEKNVSREDKGVLGHGDVWTWTAIDAESKLIVSYQVGKRDADYAQMFMADVAGRLANRVQLTTDGHAPYLQAVGDAFGSEIDYAMLVKHYGAGSVTDQRRYSPAQLIATELRPINGTPDTKHISTSFVERQNLTMRMGMRRFTRLTNGFSKKVENLEHAVSLHFMHYNFARIQKSLRVTPAMEAGISDHVWTLAEIAALAD
jgi:IS1 family transposase